jgi:predicted ATPase
VPPRALYIFKHALIQEAAYQTLLKSTRQRHHQRVARVLEEHFPETAETEPELLAHHYTEAALIAQAIPYWRRAGERAIQRSAYVEAISHLNRGLELLTSLPDTSRRAREELDLQITLGQALITTKGQAAEVCFRQALQVARRQQAKSLELRAAMSLSRVWQRQGKRDQARELLAPIYGWFTEGFDTVDLQQAKALLQELA